MAKGNVIPDHLLGADEHEFSRENPGSLAGARELLNRAEAQMAGAIAVIGAETDDSAHPALYLLGNGVRLLRRTWDMLDALENLAA